MKKVATIIRSTSHLEYVAQVINPKEEVGVSSADYALGRFLLLGKKTVGVVYDTELFNPHSLSLSSQKEEIHIYAPDFQDEVDILLKILLLGTLEEAGGDQSLPTQPLEPGTEVVQMSPEQIKSFHLTEAGKVQVRYLTNLNNFGSKLNPGLFKCINAQLKGLISQEQYKVLEVIERNLLWTSVCN
jgi:hypothetical protein